MTTLLDLLDKVDLPAPSLFICADARDQAFLSKAKSLDARLWVRTAGAAFVPTAWPTMIDNRSVVLPLPPDRATLSLCLAAACAALHKDGTLYLVGANAAGIKSAGKYLAGLFETTELLMIGGHGRLYKASQPKRRDYKLSDFQRHAIVQSENLQIELSSYPGLFAHGKLDDATALLLRHLPDPPAGSILDFACGTGVISKFLLKRQPDAKFTLVDNDALAIAAAQANLPTARCCCLADPAEITGTFDLVVSNPPIHQGQSLDYSIVETLVAAIPRLLTQNGSAYLVTQITVPVARYAAQRKLAATEIAANRSFRVTKLVRG